MNNDVRNFHGMLVVFVLGLVVWVGFLFVNACGFTLTCNRGKFPVERTPIPTLPPATLPVVETGNDVAVASDQCHVPAVDLIGAWVTAGASETEAFQFTDLDNKNCETTFEEVQPLFLEANRWYSGSLSCVSCHSVDLAVSPAQLDLSSYTGLVAGSRRANAESSGTDILGAGNWESSLLYEFLTMDHPDIPGHAEAFSDLVIFAGKPVATVELTATPIPTTAVTSTP